MILSIVLSIYFGCNLVLYGYILAFVEIEEFETTISEKITYSLSILLFGIFILLYHVLEKYMDSSTH